MGTVGTGSPMELVQLSKAEEERLLTELKENARSKCAPSLRTFADCARERTVSIVWACNSLKKDMNDCLNQYTNTKSADALKLDYILNRREQLFESHNNKAREQAQQN